MIGSGTKGTRYGVVAWLRGGLLLEKYRYAPGPAEELPKHSHAEYQLCLSLNFPGVYGYRGTSHAVPVGSLSVVHPGEVHSARDPEERLVPSSFRMMYAEPALLADSAAEVTGRGVSQPFFRDPIILDGDLAWGFLRLHVALEGAAPRLEQDARLLSALTRLVERHASVRPSPPEPGRIPADGLVGAWRTNLHADKKSHHMRSNHRITLDSDRAEVFSKGYALNILNRPTGSDLWEVWGNYTHTLDARPGVGDARA